MSARCDECGAASQGGDARCARCGAALPKAPAAPSWDGELSRAGWALLRRATVAYAIAQVALTALGAPRAALRLAVLAPVVAIPLWMARARAGAWLTPWAVLLCVGTLAALGFLIAGWVPWGGLQAVILGCSAAWSLATAVAAWRVDRGAVRGDVPRGA